MIDKQELPQGWSEKNLGDLFKLDSGSAPVKFRSGDFSGPILVHGANGAIGSCDEANYGPGYLVGRVGAAGAITKVEGPVWASDNTLTATPKPDVCSWSFAWHYLRFLKPATLATMTAQPLITQSNLSKLRAPVPEDIDEQVRIAMVLDTLDEAIAETDAVIAKLRQVRAGLIHDLLTRGLDENGELRNPNAHPEKFNNPLMGPIPREWEVKTLVTLCRHIGSGVTPRGGESVYTDIGVMFIRSQNVTFDGLVLDDVAFIPEEIHQAMLRSEVFAHDVLFNITGASIGRCCAMPAGLGRANVNQHVCILRLPDATAPSAAFLSSVLASPIGQKQLEALNTFGNRQGINYQQLGSFVIPWPEENERARIAQQIRAMDLPLNKEQQYLKKLHALKSGLMSDLLTGRVRVPEDLELAK